jgi:class 3 adenylate cyclase/tetratricopeptide (TPR) repeat protein
MGDSGADAVTYLPASLLRAVAAQPACSVPWCHEVDGTMVMADLSGFTAMSERLAKLGDEGAERLTDVINSFFTRMLGTASRYGGDTLTFGGDAILLLFDGERHAERAVAASLGMLKQVARAAAVDAGADRIKVGMSVGAHSGRFLLTAAGLPEERVHLVVLGRGAETTALVEARAERGQLAVSASTMQLLGDAARAGRLGEYWRIDEFMPTGLRTVDAERAPISDQQLRHLTPFLPPYARTTRENGAERIQLTPEHRRTVIVFVNILGLSAVIEQAGVDVAVEQLQAYAAMLTRLATKHRGFVVSSDIATSGSKLIVTFGTPVAHEYAPANAARFALDLIAGLRDSGLALQHKIGLNSGHVFAGEVGPPFRRQYTVMGDAVNLAARLMSAAAPGEALASRRLLDLAGPTLCARELPAIKVKGKEEPVAICVLEDERRPGGRRRDAAAAAGRQADRTQSRLCGRSQELELLWQSWQRARHGEGQSVLIEGEPGIGKTRLLEEALRGMRDPRAPAPRVIRAACFEHLQAAPFTPWVHVLHAVLKVPLDGPPGQRTRIVHDYLERHHPESAELGALLDPLLAVSLTQTEVVRSLQGELRRQRLFELIAGILLHPAGDGRQADEPPSIIAVEDVHWMDESSLELLRYLTEHIRHSSTLLLLTTRPSDTPVDLGPANATRFVLAELTKDESLAMVSEALELETLPPELGDAIHSKTKGNPLFLEEVVYSLQRSGALDRILSASSVTRAAELAALEIPDRVQGLLMSRIDRLSPDTREVLKVGSVVGRSFDRRVLEGVDDDLLRPVRLNRAFDELLESDLVVSTEAADAGTLTFRHALLQDVAYESLPFARRRALHGRVARFLEAAQADAPDHGLLVHHYRHAADAEKTRFHAVRASESSIAVYANNEAIDYLVIASDTAKQRTSRDACLRSRFEELMGDSLVTLARHDEAVACFSRARRRWASPSVRRSAKEALRELAPIDDADAREGLLCWKIAVSAERGRSAYKRSLHWLDKAATTVPPDRRGTAARTFITRGLVLSRLGRYREAVEVGQKGVQLAREEGDGPLQAYALNILGTVLSTQGLLDQAIACSMEAVVLYEQAGDLYGQAMGHGNVGADYVVAGDLRSALEHHERSLALHSRIGNINGIAFQHMNIGGALFQMGELDDAIRHLEEAIRLSAHPGVSRIGTGFSFFMIARSLLWSGKLEEAEQSLAEAVRILASIDAQSILLDAGIVTSELCLVRGELKRAESECRRVISRAQSMSAELSEGEALSMLGRILLARGAPEEAIPMLKTSMALAEKGGSNYERAKALALLAEAERSCGAGDASCAAKLDEAISLFEQMGARHDLANALETRRRLESTPG